MNTNQFPNTRISDPSFQDYSRYPAQALPKPAVRYLNSPSKTMAIANMRNAVGPLQVNGRPRNELLEEYKNIRASETMNLDRKELHYQVCTAKHECPLLLSTRKQQGTYCTPAGSAGQGAHVVHAIGAWFTSRAPPNLEFFRSLSYQLWYSLLWHY